VDSLAKEDGTHKAVIDSSVRFYEPFFFFFLSIPSFHQESNSCCTGVNGRSWLVTPEKKAERGKKARNKGGKATFPLFPPPKKEKICQTPNVAYIF
jgi:hypothetical protein